MTADWLSCKDGKISWTANTTGSPRTAKLEFKNGFSYEVYQIGPADFAGAWDMYVFNYYKGTYTMVLTRQNVSSSRKLCC